jgi:hypothetical protein
MANLAYSDRAAKAGPTAAETDSYLRLGLRNRWHPVLPSRFVAGSS